MLHVGRMVVSSRRKRDQRSPAIICNFRSPIERVAAATDRFRVVSTRTFGSFASISSALRLLLDILRSAFRS